jgi:hypothetical protein
MSIYYFFLGNKENDSTIASIVETSIGGTIQQFNEIKTKGDKIFSEISATETQNVDTDIENFKIYYTLKKDNYFYYIVVPNEYSENLNVEIIFNLINEINNSGIQKQIDSNGQLTNSAMQNLKLTISKYTQNKNLDDENNVNHEKLETVEDIIKESGREDVVNLGKGGEKESINVKKKGEHVELKEEVSLEEINKNSQIMEVAQNENEHPYEKMHQIIEKKIRLTKIIVYTIAIIIAIAILFRILSYGELFSE